MTTSDSTMTPWPDYVLVEVRNALANITAANERARTELRKYHSFPVGEDNCHMKDIGLWFDVTALACAALEGVIREGCK